MAVDQKNLQQLEQTKGAVDSFTDAQINALSDKNWLSALGLDSSGQVGAQNQDYYLQKLNAMLGSVKQKYQDTAQQLSTISPYFNPDNYKVDASGLTTVAFAGGGEEANRMAPLQAARQQILDMQNALTAAQQAAKTYSTTGKVAPPPDKTAYVDKVLQGLGSSLSEVNQYASAAKNDPQIQTLLGAVNSTIQGQPLSPDAMSEANAAAAYVGTDLPFKDAPIGQIKSGGVFQDSNQAQQAYTAGQLNAVGQNIVSSNSAGNMKNGVNQVINNPDGTFQWNNKTYPTKEAAVQDAAKIGVTSLRFPDGTTSTPTTSPGMGNGTSTPGAGSTTAGGQTTPTSQTDGTGAPVIDPAAQASAMNVLNGYLNNGTIDSGTYQFFKKAVEAWDPSSQIDYANILNTFEGIKSSDIDPYFKEQANVFIQDLQTNREALQASHVLETTQNDQQAKQLKENMQQDLASKGMTFTGEAVKQLGNQSAYATEGTPQAANSPIPTIAPFAGDGVLQQQTQAAGSSSDIRYQKSLQDLANQAEATLGTQGAAGLVPGAKQIGGITGTLPSQEKQAQASTLTGLYNQSQENVQAQTPQKVFNE